MELVDTILNIPIEALVLSTIVLIGLLSSMFSFRKKEVYNRFRVKFQITFISIALMLAVAIILVLPINDNLKGQLLTLFGILLSAAIAFSSTTIISNILAGIMLRSYRNMDIGDYVSVTDVTGRVTEINLLHIEIQTEESDLVAVPNMLMITNPIKVVRGSGTIVSADVSLGYDAPYSRIDELLCAAASDAGLRDAVVHITELQDFSIHYRIAGRLDDISVLLSTRTKLRVAMIDRLHRGGIEIVSPTFMNTRTIAGRSAMPEASTTRQNVDKVKIEEIAFEKAETAAKIAKLRKAIGELSASLDDAKNELSDEDKAEIEAKLDALANRLQAEKKKLDAENGKENGEDISPENQ